MKRAIITVVGRDSVGIIARVCGFLADNQINILEITQTIVKEYFNMMMIVDISKTPGTFEDLSNRLEVVGKQIGVQIKIQLEEIFDKMHRI